MGKYCEKCGSPVHNKKNRYCHGCTRRIRHQMEKSGYLQDTYVPKYFSDERGRTGQRDMRVVGGAPF